jgi:hypothetical protein
MMDEYNELYAMLSSDREDVRTIKDNYEQDISSMLSKVRNYHINRLDISGEYDLDNNFDKFKADDILLNYNLNNDSIEYKILVLQGYLNDLFVEKKFNAYKREQEDKMSKNEYLEYIHNESVKHDKVSSWYQDFMTQ